jgi:predicted O-methyltransferase YrrM
MLIPLRKLQHNPVKILAPYIKPGMKAMDFGPAMGYFSIPLAKLTGTKGKVYCVDIQEKMLEKLKQRAVKYGVNTITDKVTLFRDIRSMVKKGGKVLFAEPKGHVSEADFNRSLDIARQAGFTVTDEKPVKRGWSAMLV